DLIQIVRRDARSGVGYRDDHPPGVNLFGQSRPKRQASGLRRRDQRLLRVDNDIREDLLELPFVNVDQGQVAEVCDRLDVVYLQRVATQVERSPEQGVDVSESALRGPWPGEF